MAGDDLCDFGGLMMTQMSLRNLQLRVCAIDHGCRLTAQVSRAVRFRRRLNSLDLPGTALARPYKESTFGEISRYIQR